MTGGSFIHICYFHPENGGCIFSKLTTDSSELFILKEWQKKNAKKKMSRGLVYYNLRPNLVSWNTAVVSCPGHRWFMTLQLLREVVPLLKKWGRVQISGRCGTGIKMISRQYQLKGVVNYTMIFWEVHPKWCS